MNESEFLAKHGFPGTPSGDRMKADLKSVIDAYILNEGLMYP